MKEEIICPTCHLAYCLNAAAAAGAQYCPYCRSALNPGRATTLHLSSRPDKGTETPTPTSSSKVSISFLPEHVPSTDDVRFVIGPYQVLNSIGKGGMGEVFLAYDTTCGRRIALKKIRPDLLTHQQLHNRFLKEARITSQLTHPAIIPIYAIHSEGELTYYTMPYVEGMTLKQILRGARKQEKNGAKLDHIAQSIPALIRIFLSICQAVAYAHSKQVLHRDLKPENIIVGQYGQIVILDWGLAKIVPSGETSSADDNDLSINDEDPDSSHQLTHAGRIVGTVSYMAPERAKGEPATFRTDIYSLGVILYQMLTLKQPFLRASLKEFRQNLSKEKLIDPIEIAPYRDVPKSLSRVVLNCLAVNPEQRYPSVDNLIHDLENYIEGRSEWFQIAELDINKKSDWEFQENVLIAEHITLTREHEVSNWVSLMISKASFQENIKLEAKVKLGDKGHGIGFLLSIPEAAERTHLNDGYCLWIGNESGKSTKLLRSTVEVMHSSDIGLKQGQWHTVSIEKIDNNLHFYLDGEKQFSYISHLPLVGTHIGLLSRDADFSINDFFVYVGSQNVTVNCLAVPDAFLAHKDYTTALNEYRRIGYSFPGRAEGRDAMFRAGITLLEQGNNCQDPDEKLELYDRSLEEFHRLYNTPGAPLEYLGKALVYLALNDFEEEAKCFELAYRRYPRHPLLHVLQEQIIYRMYTSSRTNRQATYYFILLTLRFLPNVAGSSNTKKLLANLEKFWQPFDFIEPDPEIASSTSMRHFDLIIKLATWLSRPHVIEEMIEELNSTSKLNPIALANALFCLIELGSWELAQDKLHKSAALFGNLPEFKEIKELLDIAILAHSSSLEYACNAFIEMERQRSELGYDSEQQNEGLIKRNRVLFHLIELALDAGNPSLALTLCHTTQNKLLPTEASLKIDEYAIWAHLLKKEWKEADTILNKYPLEFLTQDTTPLYFLYGCLLFATEGKEIASIHFSGIFEVPYPRTWNLVSYYLKGNIFDQGGWFQKSFIWERRQLYRQLALLYACMNDEEKALEYRRKISEEFS